MTIAERNNKLKHFITCLKCEVSGKVCDENCSTQYDAGNMGEIIENLEEIAKALEQESTTKNNLGVDCISRAQVQTEIEMNASRYTIAKERCGMGQVEWSDQLIKVSDAVDIIRHLPSVTPQFSSGLEKNSKKLEKDFGESDCISREQALRELKESAEHHANDSREEVLLRRDRDIIRALPAVAPQEPKTGHWIANAPQYDMFNPQYICSECGNAHTRTTPYCEMCGCRMVEPQERSDKE